MVSSGRSSTSREIPGTPLDWTLQRRLGLAAWWWITVGGALSAVFALGLFTPSVLLVSPFGAIVGAVVGVPGAAALTSWIRLYAQGPIDARHVTSRLELIGAIAALGGCFLFLWWDVAPIVLLGDELSISMAFHAAYALTGVASSGRWVGRRLALAYLHCWELAPPPSWFNRLHASRISRTGTDSRWMRRP